MSGSNIVGKAKGAVGSHGNKRCGLNGAGIMPTALFSETQCANQLLLIQSQLWSGASKFPLPTPTVLAGDLPSRLVKLVKVGQVGVSPLTFPLGFSPARSGHPQ